MSVLLDALKKAGHQPAFRQASNIDATSTARQTYPPRQELADRKQPSPPASSLSSHWQHIAERGSSCSQASRLLQQRIHTLQQNIHRHHQFLAQQHYQQQQIHSEAPAYTQQSPPLSAAQISATQKKTPSAAAIDQLFQHHADSLSKWHWPENSTLLNATCLVGLFGLVGMIWQQDLQHFFANNSMTTAPNIASTTASNISSKIASTQSMPQTPPAIQQQQQITTSQQVISEPVTTVMASATQTVIDQTEKDNAAADLAYFAIDPTQMDMPTTDDVPIIFVEPRIPPQMTISKSKNNHTRNESLNQERASATPTAAVDAKTLLEDTQKAWSQQNKRAAAQSFRQYWNIVEQQSSSQQIKELQASFQQLFDNGYFELAFYLLQADLQQGPLHSVSIYHLFKLIPELPLETLAPFMLSLSKQHPSNSLIYFGLGNLYALHQQWQPALTQFMLAIKHDSRNADAYFNAAISAEHLQQYPEAIKAYQQALKLSQQRTFSFPHSIASERLALLQQRRH